MSYIWLGIKDYCKDVWHDWLLNHISKFHECKVYVASRRGKSKETKYVYLDTSWKEGSLKHYITQRRIFKLYNTKKDL